MSGIAGIYHLDRKPVEKRELTGMLDLIAHRGGDDRGSWLGDHVAIGHVLRHTTPESLNEIQPLVSSAGHAVLAADARVDNREELIRALGPRLVSKSSTDPELLMAAYLKWGDAFPEHVVGVYAVVVWDAGKGTLVCVRDAMGLRPLYHVYKPGRYFAFASEIKALLSLPYVSKDVDAVRVVDYIMLVEEDAERTFYRDVKSLRPAETMTVTAGGVQSTTYWQLDPQKEIRLGSSMEYAEAFRELFTEAVRCRMRSAVRLGTMLSGGLDSSSITVMMRHLGGANQDLTSISFIFDKFPACDEREYMEAIWVGGGLNKMLVAGDALNAFHDIDQVLWHADEPHIAVNLFLHLAAWEQAQQANIGVILDGFFGDSAISYGEAWATELFKAGRWVKWARILNAVANCDGVRSRREKLAYARDSVEPLIPKALRRKATRLGFEDDESYWKGQSELLNPDLRDRVRLFERLRELEVFPSPRFRTARDDHYRDLVSPAYANVFATMSKTSAAFGIDVRLPFADRRLLSFCLAIPPEQKILRGETRSILRRGMGLLLPHSIRSRNDKADLGPYFEHGVTNAGHAELETMLRDESGVLAEFLDLSVLRARLKGEVGASMPSSGQIAWYAVVLSKWLEMAP